MRPHIGYATQVWAPQFIELISKLESIQRRATKFILRLSFSTSINYRTRLQSLKRIGAIAKWADEFIVIPISIRLKKLKMDVLIDVH